RTHSNRGGDKEAAEGNSAERARAYGRTSAFLHLHRVRIFLWNRDAKGISRLSARGGLGRRSCIVCVDTVVRSYLRYLWSKERISAWSRYMRCVRLHLFRHAEHRIAGADLPCHRAVARAPRHDVWPAGGAHRGIVHWSPALQRRFTWLPACL